MSFEDPDVDEEVQEDVEEDLEVESWPDSQTEEVTT